PLLHGVTFVYENFNDLARHRRSQAAAEMRGLAAMSGAGEVKAKITLGKMNVNEIGATVKSAWDEMSAVLQREERRGPAINLTCHFAPQQFQRKVISTTLPLNRKRLIFCEKFYFHFIKPIIPRQT